MIISKTIKRLEKVKTELVVLLVLIPLVVVLGALLTRWPDLEDKGGNTEATKEHEENIIETPPSISIAPKTTAETVIPIKEAVEEVTLKATADNYNKSWQVAVKGIVSVEEVLNNAQTNSYLDIQSTDYGGSMGVFVESLGGIANNNIEKVYWHLYINDVLSPVGASQAMVKTGDTVNWKYEKQHDDN